MSVLIKGMEMPMGCYECPFEVWGKCMFIHYNAGGAELSKKCPLVKVSSHGRLIDTDELETDTEWSERYDDYIAFSRAQINATPTIIESEENGSLSTTFQQPFKAFQKLIKDKKNESGMDGCVKDSERFITVKVPKTPTYTTTMLVDITTESTNKIAEAVVEKLYNCGVKMDLGCKDESD